MKHGENVEDEEIISKTETSMAKPKRSRRAVRKTLPMS